MYVPRRRRRPYIHLMPTSKLIRHYIVLHLQLCRYIYHRFVSDIIMIGCSQRRRVRFACTDYLYRTPVVRG